MPVSLSRGAASATVVAQDVHTRPTTAKVRSLMTSKQSAPGASAPTGIKGAGNVAGTQRVRSSAAAAAPSVGQRIPMPCASL